MATPGENIRVDGIGELRCLREALLAAVEAQRAQIASGDLQGSDLSAASARYATLADLSRNVGDCDAVVFIIP